MDIKRMLDKFVLAIVQMDLGASVIILILFAFRRVVERFQISRKYYYFLWVVAFLHLVIPFGWIGERVLFSMEPAVSSEAEDFEEIEEGNADEENWNLLTAPEEPVAETEGERKKTAKLAKQNGVEFVALPVVYVEKWLLLVAQILYFPGVLFMAGWKGAEYVKLRRKLAKIAEGRGGICRTAPVTDPFSVGFLHPRIYLPETLTSDQIESVLAHEKVHVRRGDLWIKGIATTGWALHWFNPLLIPAYSRLTMEMEMACDERVIDKLEEQERMAYLRSLISLATEKKKGGSDMSVGYGTGATKKRLRYAATYQKAGMMKRALSKLLCVGIIAGAAVISFCAPTCVKAHAEEDNTVRVNPPLPENWRVEGEEVTVSAVSTTAAGDRWQDGMQLVAQQVDIMPPAMDRAGVTYEARTHTYYFSIFEGTTLLKLRATCEYTVYYYTDGKVHLYSRGIGLYTAPDFSNSYVTYGSMVNTDGSYSGTVGDRVTAIQGSIRRVFGLSFTVNSTDGPAFNYAEYTGN